MGYDGVGNYGDTCRQITTPFPTLPTVELRFYAQKVEQTPIYCYDAGEQREVVSSWIRERQEGLSQRSERKRG